MFTCIAKLYCTSSFPLFSQLVSSLKLSIIQKFARFLKKCTNPSSESWLQDLPIFPSPLHQECFISLFPQIFKIGHLKLLSVDPLGVFTAEIKNINLAVPCVVVLATAQVSGSQSAAANPEGTATSLALQFISCCFGSLGDHQANAHLPSMEMRS